MQKTKLGLTVGALGAITFLAVLTESFLVVAVIAGYVLMCEENPWLKKMAVKAVGIVLAFTFMAAVIGLLPQVFNLIVELVQVFDSSFMPEDGLYDIMAFLQRLVTFLRTVLNFTEVLIVVLLAVKAFNQATLRIPVIDSLISKYMD